MEFAVDKSDFKAVKVPLNDHFRDLFVLILVYTTLNHFSQSFLLTVQVCIQGETQTVMFNFDIHLI